MHYVGEVSYGIYLWHLFAIELCLGLHGTKPPQALALTLGVTLLLASVSWHFSRNRFWNLVEGCPIRRHHPLLPPPPRGGNAFVGGEQRRVTGDGEV